MMCGDLCKTREGYGDFTVDEDPVCPIVPNPKCVAVGLAKVPV